MTDTQSPLLTSSPSSIDDLFTADPITLTASDRLRLINELRRRRSLHLSDEAAKAAKGKKAVTKSEPKPAAISAALDKPASELSLDDL